MAWGEDSNEDDGAPAWRRYLLLGGSALAVIALTVGVVVMVMSGDKDPPRKVNELQVTMVLPPPPPPPPPPEQQPEQPPEQKVMEQTPVKDVVEEKQVDIPKDAPPDAGPDPTPGPPDLGLGNGPGSGGLAQGKGRGGGGGGGGNSRFGWYASIVQSQMEAALQANEKTRYASMQAVIRVWLDNSGKVSRVQLSPSTGDGALDATIRDQVIGGMRMREPPPKDMPMPIITRITARSRAG